MRRPYTVPGSMDRYGTEMYIEDIHIPALQKHVDMPGNMSSHNMFNRSLYKFDGYAGSVIPHPGLVELMDSARLKKQVALDRLNNAYSNTPKHSSVHGLRPGFIPDFRPQHAKHVTDFGGLDAPEVIDGEEKLRLYTTYTAMPGIGLYGNEYQNSYF